MKTLQGIELEGELLTLYRYHFAPNGGAVEADLMAQAVGLQEDLKILITLQQLNANLITSVIDRAMDSSISLEMAYRDSGLPNGMVRFFFRGAVTTDSFLRECCQNNQYVFKGLFCAMPIYIPIDEEQCSEFAEPVSFSSPNDDGQATMVFLPLDSPKFPEYLKTHPYYAQAAIAVKKIAWCIFTILRQRQQHIDLSQIFIQTNHPLLGTLDHTILQ